MAGKCGLSAPLAVDKSVAAVSPTHVRPTEYNRHCQVEYAKKVGLHSQDFTVTLQRFRTDQASSLDIKFGHDLELHPSCIKCLFVYQTINVANRPSSLSLVV